MYASSGTTAHVTDSAVRTASAQNSATLIAPCTGPGRLHATAAAMTAPQTKTPRISTIVVRLSSLPPAAPKATPARAPPRITSAARRAWERSTRCRDLGYQRHAREQRDAAAQGDEQAGHCQQRQGDQRCEQRRGQVVAGAGQVEQAVVAGLDGLAADLDARRLRTAVVACDLRERFGVLLAVRLFLRGERLAARTRRAGAVVALVGSARDGAGEDLAAIAVLVAVGRQVVERLLELGVRVVAVEVVVANAVGQRAGLRGGGQHEQGDHAQH